MKLNLKNYFSKKYNIVFIINILKLTYYLIRIFKEFNK